MVTTLEELAAEAERPPLPWRSLFGGCVALALVLIASAFVMYDIKAHPKDPIPDAPLQGEGSQMSHPFKERALQGKEREAHELRRIFEEA